jgi:uncharacterized protein YneF (UPF0154 family)
VRNTSPREADEAQARKEYLKLLNANPSKSEAEIRAMMGGA